jgi:hypothetical protein
LFTENSSGTLLDTTNIADDPQRSTWQRFSVAEEPSGFKLPGKSIEEVSAQWGVGGSKPCAYDGKHLYFTSLDVRQGAKLARLHPNGGRLEGRRLEASRSDDDCSVRLNQALDAGIIPSTGILYVDPTLEDIYLPREELQIDEFKAPVLSRRSYWEKPIILCPEHLLPTYLMPSAQAVRTYVIPSGIQPFRVRTQRAAAPSNEDPPGSYYLVADLRNLVARDLNKERAERRARNKSLVDRYGGALPKGYEKLSEEQIALYFEIQDLVQTGELIQAEHHPLMPPSYHGRFIVDWLRKQAPQLIKTCPVTRQNFVRRLDGFEDLVDIPGFWHAVETTLGGGTWLRKLITCPKVQASALISAI